MKRSLTVDLEEIARNNPDLDLDVLTESMRMQDELKSQGYRPEGFRLDILGIAKLGQFSDAERANRQLILNRSAP